MWKLLSHRIEINDIVLDGVTAHIKHRLPDSSFNFDFITESFVTKDSTKIKPQEKDTTKAAWTISILGVELKDIYFTMDDQPASMTIYSRLGHFKTDLSRFSLEKKQYHMDEILLENTKARIVQFKNPPQPKDTTTPKPLDYDVSLKTLNINNVDVVYDNKITQKFMSYYVGKTEVHPDKIDLLHHKIDLKDLKLDNSNALVIINEKFTADSVATDVGNSVTKQPEEKTTDWVLTLKDVSLGNNAFRYDNFNNDRKPEGIDFNHLFAKNINLSVSDLYYSEKKIDALINGLSLSEQSGFRLDKVAAKFTFDSVHAVLDNLDVETPYTRIGNYIAVSYPAPSALADSPSVLGLNLNLDRNVISLKDILFFAPQLASKPPFSRDPNALVHLSSSITGKIGDLNIHNLAASGFAQTVVVARGRIKGLPDMNKTWMDLDIPQLSSGRTDLLAFLPRGSVPQSVQIPQSININGAFKGFLNDFFAKARIRTSFGNALANLKMKKIKGPQKYAYNAIVSTSDLDLARLLKNKSLGPVTLHSDINGAGFDPNVMHAAVNLHVDKAVANHYPYKNLTVKGVIAQKAFTGTADMNDSNIAFKYNGTVSFRKQSPSYDFTFKLEGADFQRLKLTDKDIRAKGEMVAKISGSDMNDLNGGINMYNVVLVKSDRQYPINHLAFVSISEKQNRSITISSDFLNGYFKGTINLADLPEELEQHMETYFSFRNVEKKSNRPPQNFDFQLEMNRTDIITDIFYPDLKELVPGVIKGHYKSADKDLNIDIQIPRFVYKNIAVDTFTILVKSDPRKLDYTVHFNQVKQGDVVIQNTDIAGTVQNDTIATALAVKDDKGKERYKLGVNLRSADNLYMMRVLPDGVIFDYTKWAVAPDNYIRFDKGPFAHNVSISNGDHRLVISSNGPESGSSPMTVAFTNFDLAPFTSFLAGNQHLVNGIVDGNVNLQHRNSTPGFSSDLTIKGFAYKNDLLGDLAVKADNLTAGRYTANVRLTGNNNDLTADGYYAPEGKAEALNFNVDITRLNLASLNPYSGGMLTDMSGGAAGKLSLTGSTNAPNINGTLGFDNAGFTLGALNTHFTIPHDNLVFDNSGIKFNHFTLEDSAKNTAVVDGYILTRYFTKFTFNMEVVTDRFLALNSQPKKGSQYYGKLVLSSRSKITGDLSQPVVESRITLEEGTDMVIVMPSKDPSIVDRKGVVEFVNIANPPNPIVYRIKQQDTSNKVNVRGIILTANIDANKKAKLRIIVDPDAGDYLDVKGEGTLSFGISPSGFMSLTGRYEIQEGAYQLSFFNFVKRKFDIKQGSTITWLGTPTQADLDITAVYTTKTSAYALMENHTTGTENMNIYKQQLPFKVIMTMKGALKKPAIDLDVDVADEDKGAFNGAVVNRLAELRQDKSELNKQVFGLIVLNHFVTEHPLENPGSGDNPVYTAVASSLSEVLSQQLNTFASKYVKDVQLNFNVESYNDYRTGTANERTDLKVGLQKDFLSDRLTVNVGSSVNVEGEHKEQMQSNQLVSDLLVEYKLTKDGRLRLTLFRNNQYAGIIEGQLVETGTGLIFVRDFNRFRQLFTKPREDNAYRKERRKEKRIEGTF